MSVKRKKTNLVPSQYVRELGRDEIMESRVGGVAPLAIRGCLEGEG